MNSRGQTVTTVSSVIGTGKVKAAFVGLPSTLQGAAGNQPAATTIELADNANQSGLVVTVTNVTQGVACGTITMTGTGPYTGTLDTSTLSPAPADGDVLQLSYNDVDTASLLTADITVKLWNAPTITVTPNNIVAVQGVNSTNISVTVTDPDIISGNAVTLTVNTNGALAYDLSGIASANGTFSATFTIGQPTGGANIEIPSGLMTADIVESDAGSAGTNSTLQPLNDPAGIQVDGYIDSTGYTPLGDGQGNSWSQQIMNVNVGSDGTYLYIAWDWTADPTTSGNNLFVVVDDNNLTGAYSNTIGSGLNDLTTTWGDLGIVNNVPLDADYVLWGNTYNAASWGMFGYGGTNSIVSGAPSDASGTKTAYSGYTYEIGIPYSTIGSGASTGDSVNVYILYGQNAASSGIHSVFPAGQPSDNPCVSLTNAGTAYTLQ
jgi:hypothetical protein